VLDETGNDHGVVGILRKSQPPPGQLGRQFQQAQVHIRRYTQVDLGIDHADFQRDAQGHGSQRIDAARTVATNAAQHEALAVVALLHAGIEVAVLVQREEELGQQVLGSAFIQTSGLQIGLQIRPHVLIEPAQAAVIVAAHPERRVTEPQGLKSLPKRARRPGGHLFQHVGHILPALVPRGLRVTRRQSQNRVDRLDGAVEELRYPRIGGVLCGRGFRHGATTQESLAEDHPPVGADIADRPQFVQLSACGQSLPIRGAVQRRNLLNRAREHDAFIRPDHDLLGLAHPASQASAAPDPREVLALALGEQIDLRPTASDPVIAIAYGLSHRFETVIHPAWPLSLSVPAPWPSNRRP